MTHLPGDFETIDPNMHESGVIIDPVKKEKVEAYLTSLALIRPRLVEKYSVILAINGIVDVDEMKELSSDLLMTLRDHKHGKIGPAHTHLIWESFQPHFIMPTKPKQGLKKLRMAIALGGKDHLHKLQLPVPHHEGLTSPPENVGAVVVPGQISSPVAFHETVGSIKPISFDIVPLLNGSHRETSFGKEEGFVAIETPVPPSSQ